MLEKLTITGYKRFGKRKKTLQSNIAATDIHDASFSVSLDIWHVVFVHGLPVLVPVHQ